MADYSSIFRSILGVLLVLVLWIRKYFQQKSESVQKQDIKVDLDKKVLIFIESFLLTVSNLATIVYVIKPAMMVGSSIKLNLGLRWVGSLLGLLSVGLLFWTYYSLGSNFFSGLKIRKNHEFVSSGPYRWVRHPMYFAFLAIGISWFLISGNLILSGTWLAGSLLAVVTRLHKEERMMLDEFGDPYRRYVHQTGRMIFKFKS